jgi:hypothetical protein
MPEPKRVDPPQPAPVLKAVPDDLVYAPEPAREPKPAIAKPEPKPARVVREPKPAIARREPAVAEPEPKKPQIAEEPATDTPATVMAMRMLNKRVAELDAKIQELTRRLEATPAAPAPKKRFGR